MKRLLASLVAVSGLVLVACSDDGDDEADGSTTTTAGDDATTTTEGDGTSTTAGGGEACPTVAPPAADAASLTELQADVDGDGAGDAVSVYGTAEGWHLRVDLGAGGAAEETLTTVATDTANIETTRDLDGDGDDELWVVVGHGASTVVYGLFDLDGCDLEAVELAGGPAEFAVGGPILLLQGVRCEDDGRIDHLGATSEDGESFTTLDLTYQLEAGELVRVDDDSTTLTADDPAFAAYTTFDC